VSTWAAVGGSQPSTQVDLYTLNNTTGAVPYNHSRQYPADGTLLATLKSGYYVVSGGTPKATSAKAGGVLIDVAAITNRSKTVPWNHLK